MANTIKLLDALPIFGSSKYVYLIIEMFIEKQAGAVAKGLTWTVNKPSQQQYQYISK